MGLSVINRATLDRRFSAGTHSADDQVEWLNNSTVIDGVLQDQAIAALNL